LGEYFPQILEIAAQKVLFRSVAAYQESGDCSDQTRCSQSSV